jgi:hypothetical protein
MANYFLPAKLHGYLRRLLLNYEHGGPKDLASILRHGRIAISPDTGRYYDRGQEHFGHSVVIFLPPENIAPLTIKKQEEACDRLVEELRACAKSFDGEYVHAVRIELEDDTDFLFDISSSLSGPTPTNPDSLSFWKAGHIRLFISHRDPFRREAAALALALEKFGISCFVAHDHIEPMESWQHQIEAGLETMEVFLAMVTDDFHDSVWTNQEVGFARSRGVPVVCLKLGAAPKGFIADKQALTGDPQHPELSANGVYQLMAEKLGMRERLQPALITAFCESKSYNDTKERFDRMRLVIKKLSKDEAERIKNAYQTNDQIHGAAYLHFSNRFTGFLESAAGEKVSLVRGKVVPLEEDEEIPF